MESAASGKIALVLSAGGMFGAYQAGAWQVLEDLFLPDLVIGASVGSLNGWVIASHQPASELVERWLALDELQTIKFRIPRSWADGFIEAQLLENWIRELADTVPQIPFGLVTTRLPSLRPRLFQNPGLDWRHLLASCAVPGLLNVQRFDGALHADGGLVDPLPLWAAQEMGATAAIAVNVMYHRPAAVKAWVKCARVWSRSTPLSCAGMKVVEIYPSEPLGSPRDSMYWSRGNAERWIELGRRDAARLKHSVVECLESACRS